LLEQFGAMHQHERVHAALRDDRRRGHGLAEGGRRARHSDVVLDMAVAARAWSARNVPAKRTVSGDPSKRSSLSSHAMSLSRSSSCAASRHPRGSAIY
jgi:hypothetical protein